MPKSYSQKTTRTGSLAEWVPLKKILKLLGKIDDSSRLNIIQLTNDYLTIKFYQAIYGLRSFKEIRNLIWSINSLLAINKYNIIPSCPETKKSIWINDKDKESSNQINLGDWMWLIINNSKNVYSKL